MAVRSDLDQQPPVDHSAARGSSCARSTTLSLPSDRRLAVGALCCSCNASDTLGDAVRVICVCLSGGVLDRGQCDIKGGVLLQHSGSRKPKATGRPGGRNTQNARSKLEGVSQLKSIEKGVQTPKPPTFAFLILPGTLLRQTRGGCPPARTLPPGRRPERLFCTTRGAFRRSRRRTYARSVVRDPFERKNSPPCAAARRAGASSYGCAGSSTWCVICFCSRNAEAQRGWLGCGGSQGRARPSNAFDPARTLSNSTAAPPHDSWSAPSTTSSPS